MGFRSDAKYHIKVFFLALKETRQDLFGDIKNFIGDIFISIVSGLAYAIRSYLLRQDTIDWVGIIGAALLGVLAWGIVLLLKNIFWKIPAELYKEEKSKALYSSWRNIDTKPFTFERDSGFGIGLEVISDKQLGEDGFINVSEKNSYVVRVEQGGKLLLNNGELLLPLVGGGNSVYSVFEYIRNRKGRTVNTAIEHTVFPIANWDENQAWIVSQDGRGNSGIVIEKDVTCRVLMILMGEIIRKQPLEFFQVWCDLLYHSNGNGKMTMTLKNINRHVEYEL